MATRKQKADIELCKYYCPKNILADVEITEEDEQMYLEWSESGQHKDKIYGASVGRIPNEYHHGLQKLIVGKQWRDRMIEIYETDFVSGSWIGYYSLLDGAPAHVKDFLAHNMFGGADREIIEKTWQK